MSGGVKRDINKRPVVGLLSTTPDEDGRRGHVLFTSTDDRRLLITFGVQLCVQRNNITQHSVTFIAVGQPKAGFTSTLLTLTQHK